MTRFELNEIIEKEHEYPVYVSELVYDEVEELYIADCKTTKSQIGSFYQKYDYQGVRNALEVVNNIKEFKSQMLDNLMVENKVEVSPSQLAYLEMIGWNVSKLNLIVACPWAHK